MSQLLTLSNHKPKPARLNQPKHLSNRLTFSRRIETLHRQAKETTTSDGKSFGSETCDCRGCSFGFWMVSNRDRLQAFPRQTPLLNRQIQSRQRSRWLRQRRRLRRRCSCLWDDVLRVGNLNKGFVRLNLCVQLFIKNLNSLLYCNNYMFFSTHWMRPITTQCSKLQRLV